MCVFVYIYTCINIYHAQREREREREKAHKQTQTHTNEHPYTHTQGRARMYVNTKYICKEMGNLHITFFYTKYFLHHERGRTRVPNCHVFKKNPLFTWEQIKIKSHHPFQMIGRLD